MRRLFGFALVLLTGPAGVVVGQATPPDSQRANFAIRVLQLVQGFQMASTPELSAAVNALLEDDGIHMHMLPKRDVAPGDSARAAEIVKTARAALEKYTDVKVAEKDGYVKFMPWLEDQSIFHYNNIQNAMSVLGTFDATKPVSLLYKKADKGEMKLVGVMYNALPSATPADLDARLPTSVAHWHEHVDFCAANIDSIRAGTLKVDAAYTAKMLRITTRDECAKAGGRFVPRLFGWMVHVYLFAGDDPATIWGGDDHGSMNVHVHHPPAPPA